MRLPQPVNPFAESAEHHRRSHQGHQQRVAAHHPRAVAQDAAHRLPRALLVGCRLKTVFGHHDHQRHGQRHHQRPAQQDGQVQLQERQSGAGEDTHQRADVVGLLSARVNRPDVLDADFIDDPGIQRAADERVADAGDHLRAQDGDERRHSAFQHEARAQQELADDHAQAAAVAVGQHASGHLEDESRDLQYRAHQHQLQRVHAYCLHEVHRKDGEDGAARQRRHRRHQQIDLICA